MKITVKITVEVKVPEGATRYRGDLLDEPTWWKFQVNSTGVIRAWYFWNRTKQCWHYQGGEDENTPPYFTHPIPTEVVERTAERVIIDPEPEREGY